MLTSKIEEFRIHKEQPATPVAVLTEMSGPGRRRRGPLTELSDVRQPVDGGVALCQDASHQLPHVHHALGQLRRLLHGELACSGGARAGSAGWETAGATTPAETTQTGRSRVKHSGVNHNREESPAKRHIMCAKEDI